jgi:hypothetical protein
MSWNEMEDVQRYTWRKIPLLSLLLPSPRLIYLLFGLDYPECKRRHVGLGKWGMPDASLAEHLNQPGHRIT